MKLSAYKRRTRQNVEYREAEEELWLAFALGDAVLRARLERGWSQEELARRVGTRQANISRIEKGLGNPTLDLIRRLCQALEIEVRFAPSRRESG